MSEKYQPDFEQFLQNHPEIDPAWRNLIEPAVADSEEAIFNFIICYIFM